MSVSGNSVRDSRPGPRLETAFIHSYNCNLLDFLQHTFSPRAHSNPFYRHLQKLLNEPNVLLAIVWQLLSTRDVDNRLFPSRKYDVHHIDFRKYFKISCKNRQLHVWIPLRFLPGKPGNSWSFTIYLTAILISSRSSRMSSFVRLRESYPLMRHECFMTTRSSHPQRLRRPVVVPYSRPTSCK